MQSLHIPVLAKEVLRLLNPQAGEHYLDLTAGYGGHARSVLDKIGANGRAVLVDRDQNAVEHITKLFTDDPRIEVLHQDYLSASRQLLAEGRKFDCILADIGLSSPHLDNAERGFSFSLEGPLDMRMDPRLEVAANDIVNRWDREDLISILQGYGEIRGAPKLADAIIQARPLQTTTELASIINKSTRGYPKIRNEAKVFQAIRIAVNAELEQLEQSLPLWKELLNTNGRLAVISFHSLEDRIVKRFASEYGGDRYDAELKLLTKGPVTSTEQENNINPRARSAKLRVMQRK